MSQYLRSLIADRDEVIHELKAEIEELKSEIERLQQIVNDGSVQLTLLPLTDDHLREMAQEDASHEGEQAEDFGPVILPNGLPSITTIDFAEEANTINKLYKEFPLIDTVDFRGRWLRCLRAMRQGAITHEEYRNQMNLIIMGLKPLQQANIIVSDKCQKQFNRDDPTGQAEYDRSVEG
jgi:hypothetical protein